MHIQCKPRSVVLFVTCLLSCINAVYAWQADNGNGTFTNPLFYDEFSDPDLIRVGDDFYLTGTTMHTMPGLPILHSRDLVNWELLTYAFEKLDLGPELRMEDGRTFYGQGIWAPSFRYHDGNEIPHWISRFEIWYSSIKSARLLFLYLWAISQASGFQLNVSISTVL